METIVLDKKKYLKDFRASFSFDLQKSFLSTVFNVFESWSNASFSVPLGKRVQSMIIQSNNEKWN